MPEAEVLVVGAGPSGAGIALHLARSARSVIVMDRARFPRDKACGEGLMPAGVAALARLDLLDTVRAAGAVPLDGIAYTHLGTAPSAFAPFPPPPAGGDFWGLGVRRTWFDAVLADALRQQPGVELLEGRRATGLLRGRSGAVRGVTTEQGEVRARVVVAADGLHSPLRAAAGWTMPARGEARYGLAGHWRLDVRDWRAVTVTFAGDHEWYACPVESGLLLVSVLAGRVRTGVIAHDYQRLARQAIPALRDAELEHPPLAAGGFRQIPRAVAGDGLFLVGDAAGYDDPTTGEGLSIGFLLAERLAAHLAALLSGEIDSATAAQRYRGDHARLHRDRRRVTALALRMARAPRISRRAVARAAERPQTLSAFLGINCGYWGFGRLTPRDWLAMAGF